MKSEILNSEQNLPMLFQPGILVINDNNDVVMVCNINDASIGEDIVDEVLSDSSSSKFVGMLISSSNVNYAYGYKILDVYYKKNFSKFNGSIKLSN